MLKWSEINLRAKARHDNVHKWCNLKVAKDSGSDFNIAAVLECGSLK